MTTDTKNTGEQLQIDNLEALDDTLRETLADSVEPRKNLSLRISEGRHRKYKSLSDCYKKSFDKSLPLGELGDQLVDQLNTSLVNFILKKITLGSLLIEIGLAGFQIDIVSLHCKNSDGREAGDELRKWFVSKIENDLKESVGNLDMNLYYELFNGAKERHVANMEMVRNRVLNFISRHPNATRSQIMALMNREVFGTNTKNLIVWTIGETVSIMRKNGDNHEHLYRVDGVVDGERGSINNHIKDLLT
jgi:hypothetical protein